MPGALRPSLKMNSMTLTQMSNPPTRISKLCVMSKVPSTGARPVDAIEEVDAGVRPATVACVCGTGAGASGPKANSTELKGRAILSLRISDMGSMGGLYEPEFTMQSMMKQPQYVRVSMAMATASRWELSEDGSMG